MSDSFFSGKDLRILQSVICQVDETLDKLPDLFNAAFLTRDHFLARSVLLFLLNTFPQSLAKPSSSANPSSLNPPPPSNPAAVNPSSAKSSPKGLHSMVLSPPERLAALFLLMPSKQPSSFLPALIELMLDQKNSPCEKDFIAQLLNGPRPHVLKSTSRFLVASFNPSIRSPQPDVTQLLKEYHAKSPKQGSHVPHHLAVSSLLVDPSLPLEFESDAQEEAFLQAIAEEALRPSGFLPSLLVPMPPLLDPRDDEVFWMDPEIVSHKIEWDYGMAFEESQGLEFKQISAKAFKGPLPMPQQQQLLASLEENPKLVYHSGLTPGKLPELVENNPTVAIEFILKMASSPHLHDYYKVLVHMAVTLHSVEVMNKLTMTCDVPSEYIQSFVINCIRTCESIREKYTQNRLVRVVCIFLQSLIRNKKILDLFIEVQSFALAFSSSKEAAMLYKLLKSIESDTYLGGTGHM